MDSEYPHNDSESTQETSLQSLPTETLDELMEEPLPVRRPVLESAVAAQSAIDGLITGGKFGPPRAQQAFRDYVGLGKGRTLQDLAKIYCHPACKSWTDNYESVLRMLKDYSRFYKWQDNLRMIVAKAQAEVLASVQREAFVHGKVRIDLAQQAQEAGKIILERAELEKLTVREARSLLKSAATLLQLGLVSERAEQGDMLAMIRPDKPIGEMSEEELDEFAMTLQKAIN
jgi:hypothetical protein